MVSTHLHMRDADVSGAIPPPDPDEPAERDVQGKGKPKRKESEERARLGDVTIDPSIDYTRYSASGPGLESRAELTESGLINIWVNLRQPVPLLPDGYAPSIRPFASEPAAPCPNLNIVIFLVGSRGDVQPYLALALELITQGYRVRIATHGTFREFVLEQNERLHGKQSRCGLRLDGMLEFFDIGGDPKELMAYMVKNPGLLPGLASLTNGDIKSKRAMTKAMLRGCYRACYEPDQTTARPFAADVIMSNPPAFAHIHVAEALGLPLIVSFTMPWSPTQAFPHPLVNVQRSNAEPGLTNYISYALADTLMWQGLGDVINDFRCYILSLPPLSLRTGPLVLDRLKVPMTYAWSQSILPMPRDWKGNIDISGFYFLESNTKYHPDLSLQKFLTAGDPPIYFGFGSVVVEDPETLTCTILEAIRVTGTRAIISAGWADLGALDLPDTVFLIRGDVPHDWLFAQGRVAAVCHHGGAGTTAIGLKNGRPTIAVPFFGDQKFWGQAIANAGAGPAPLPYRFLSVTALVSAIQYVTSEPARTAASRIAARIASDGGVEAGAASFNAHLPLAHMKCDVSGDVAVWWDERHCLKLGSQVVGVLVAEKKVDWRELTPYPGPMEYDSSRTITDPILGGAGAILSLLTQTFGSTAQLFWKPQRAIVNMVYGIPKASFDVVGSIHSGFENVPYILGSRVRPRRRVESFGVGVSEGFKGLGYGLYDGVTGLVMEPLEGAKTGGFGSALAGLGRSYINVAARPAAGALGVVVLPVTGAFRAARAALLHQEWPSHVLAAPRQALSIEAARNESKEDRQAIVTKWVALTSPGIVKMRKEQCEKLLSEAIGKPKVVKKERDKGRANSERAASMDLPPFNKPQSTPSVASDSALERSRSDSSVLSSIVSSPSGARASDECLPLSPPTPESSQSGLSHARAYAQAYRTCSGSAGSSVEPSRANPSQVGPGPYAWSAGPTAADDMYYGAAASEVEIAMAGTERWAAPSVRSGMLGSGDA
ncbi:hypothetical protein Q5752_004624 [Cryptotrichosporon argae]